jgi:hypothetical protein
VTGGEDAVLLAERLAHLEAERDRLQRDIDTHKAALLTLLGPGATVGSRDGTPLYRAMPGRRTFRQNLAEAVLPEPVRALCTTPTVDAGKVKRLSPALWEYCCAVGAPYLQAVR